MTLILVLVSLGVGGCLGFLICYLVMWPKLRMARTELEFWKETCDQALSHASQVLTRWMDKQEEEE